MRCRLRSLRSTSNSPTVEAGNWQIPGVGDANARFTFDSVWTRCSQCQD